ncbi:MAG: four helix bundle protein [Chitinophagales bacterium]|nr:four helix bundle protein [Chitinophagales bacterium]
MKENVLLDKSYSFFLRIVNLYKYLAQSKKAFILSKQLVRSGTSIGANIEEAIGGQSRKDFYAKINVAYKEARETHYWLRIFRDTNYITQKQASSILEDCDELLKIIGSIIRTIKSKIPNS